MRFYTSQHRSPYLTSTITWSYADGYYVIQPNDNLFYYPFPSNSWNFWNKEISWVTYDDSSLDSGYWINHNSHQMKENGIAFMAHCIQNLRSRQDRRWIHNHHREWSDW